MGEFGATAESSESAAAVAVAFGKKLTDIAEELMPAAPDS